MGRLGLRVTTQRTHPVVQVVDRQKQHVGALRWIRATTGMKARQGGVHRSRIAPSIPPSIAPFIVEPGIERSISHPGIQFWLAPRASLERGIRASINPPVQGLRVERTRIKAVGIRTVPCTTDEDRQTRRHPLEHTPARQHTSSLHVLPLSPGLAPGCDDHPLSTLALFVAASARARNCQVTRDQRYLTSQAIITMCEDVVSAHRRRSARPSQSGSHGEIIERARKPMLHPPRLAGIGKGHRSPATAGSRSAGKHPPSCVAVHAARPNSTKQHTRSLTMGSLDIGLVGALASPRMSNVQRTGRRDNGTNVMCHVS